MSKFNSSFWYDDFDTDDIIVDQLSDKEKKSLDLYKLASSKRAISNFVNIVTNESIPVRFKERGDSYTDGNQLLLVVELQNQKILMLQLVWLFTKVHILNFPILTYFKIYTI